MTPTPNHHDSRWICWQCADLDYLNDDGLCWECAPERVVEWWQLVAQVTHGKQVERRAKWRIG